LLIYLFPSALGSLALCFKTGLLATSSDFESISTFVALYDSALASSSRIETKSYALAYVCFN
jgi:hypothetical protein